MKNVFESLGISVLEFSCLLVISEQTLYAWFTRKTMIPLPHSTYISALEICHSRKKEEDWELLRNRAELENDAMAKAEGQKICKHLTARLQQAAYKLEKLKQKEQKLLNRWYLAENYAQYLTSELQKSEHVIGWCGLMGRRSKFELADVRLGKKIGTKNSGIGGGDKILAGVTVF